MSTAATYTHLRDGSWGIRVSGAAKAGQTVTVCTKAGEQKAETVRAVLWSGRDSKSGETISLCAIQQRQQSVNRGDRAPGGRACPECGSRECAKAWDSHSLCDED